MDLHYVRRASLMMDLQIMMRTPGALLFQMLLAFQQKRLAARRAALRQSGGETAPGCPPNRQRQLL